MTMEECRTFAPMVKSRTVRATIFGQTYTVDKINPKTVSVINEYGTGCRVCPGIILSMFVATKEDRHADRQS